MSLLGENPYKIRAFDKAARIIDSHPEEMGVLIDEDRLRSIPGIGESLAHIILHYTKSGGASIEAELSNRLPDGIAELLELPGLGLKTVQILWQHHGITDLSQLQFACEDGTLNGVKGFGEKLSAKLLSAIQFRNDHAHYYHLDLALKVGQRWFNQLANSAPDCRVEFTGDIRRTGELIEQVDILVDIPVEQVAELLEVGQPIHDQDRSYYLIEDNSGIPVLIWSATNETFFWDQWVQTGGRSYSESVLAKVDLAQESPTTPISSEQMLCDSMGIEWLEPELRDLFEVRPHNQELVKPADIKGVFHAHSTWSDGRNSLEEMVSAVAERGYQYFGITEHSQAAYYAHGLEVDRVKAQWDRIDVLNDQHPELTIFKGIEADILRDGSLDYDETLLAGFDFVIASIHSHFHLDPAQQTQRLMRALQSPFTTMLGHPTGRMLLAREGYAPDMQAVIETAAENHKIIEINTTPKRLDLDWRHLKYARELGVQVSINPDAHRISAIDTIPLGVMMARKGGFTAADVVNTMDAPTMTKKLAEWRSR